MFDRRYDRIEGETHNYGFLGALWRGEQAWRLEVSCEKQAGFADDALITFKDWQVPTGAEVIRQRAVVERDGARLESVAMLGPGAKHDDVATLNPNIWPQPGTIMIVLNGSLRAQGRSFALVSLVDETGRPLELEDEVRRPMSADSERNVPYMIKFRRNAMSQTASLTVALPKIVRAEFVAKPTHE